MAQFVSFDPSLSQRLSRILGLPAGHRTADARGAIAALLYRAPEGTVNVRTFLTGNPQTTGFRYGIGSLDEACAVVSGFGADGLYTIVNETVDIHDGGVSGVVHGDLVEFAPGDTPRCVEKPGTAALPRNWARRILTTVYGIEPPFQHPQELRIEFSLHPLRRGVRHEHVIVWESAVEDDGYALADVLWPNRFSRFVGDKAYGLLVAHAAGLPVPRTTVLSRNLAPFSFGRDTGLPEVWLRTCPNEQTPGKFTTQRGWTDPFRLMAAEDAEGTAIASVLAQAGIDARHSGAAVAGADGQVFIEGVRGFGDGFMQGSVLPENLPEDLVSRVQAVYDEAHSRLGPVRFEWVDDGREV